MKIEVIKYPSGDQLPMLVDNGYIHPITQPLN